jgi:hypothetical protein
MPSRVILSAAKNPRFLLPSAASILLPVFLRYMQNPSRIPPSIRLHKTVTAGFFTWLLLSLRRD